MSNGPCTSSNGLTNSAFHKFKRNQKEEEPKTKLVNPEGIMCMNNDNKKVYPL